MTKTILDPDLKNRILCNFSFWFTFLSFVDGEDDNNDDNNDDDSDDDDDGDDDCIAFC